MERRIYGERVSIDTGEVKKFWDKRAESFEEKGIGAVLCRDQAPETQDKRNAFSHDYLLPRLKVDKDTQVLDVGCGIGRMAEMLLPLCGFYCGTDFSPKMVQAAGQTCARIKEECPSAAPYQLYPLSYLETMEKGPGFFGRKFGLLVSMGVCMYINDAELEQSFCRLPELMDEHSTICISEAVGLGKRLTLNRFPSEALQTDYSVIYRTREEYLAFFAPLLEAGFSVEEESYVLDYGHLYSDSGRWYSILRR